MRTAADSAGVFAYWPNRITMIRFVGSLVLSIQKFLAFTISVVFVNPVLRTSVVVWCGAAAVLVGTVAYSAASAQPSPRPRYPATTPKRSGRRPTGSRTLRTKDAPL